MESPSPLRWGVVVDFDEDAGTGWLVDSAGQKFKFSYGHGQSVVSDGDNLPAISGRHHQPAGGRLKQPRIGDGLLVEVPGDSSSVAAWAYAVHFLDVLQRRFGSEFVPSYASAQRNNDSAAGK